ncbi:hypothetical protein B0A48_15353 [Cryoendolithus antarcticus]|uniref:Uncharacterized protein n=1 Tax=Cryoendolithus antarcticus TaxID=1507870 RepID=A0A1V8SI25_9PEZI|nr:hypothetical protein B0A48_15353 [Cryoendolithus antarcticus]
MQAWNLLQHGKQKEKKESDNTQSSSGSEQPYTPTPHPTTLRGSFLTRQFSRNTPKEPADRSRLSRSMQALRIPRGQLRSSLPSSWNIPLRSKHGDIVPADTLKPIFDGKDNSPSKQAIRTRLSEVQRMLDEEMSPYAKGLLGRYQKRLLQQRENAGDKVKATLIEREFCSHTALRNQLTAEILLLEQNIRMYKEMELYIRWGDYLAEWMRRFRDGMPDPDKEVPRYVTDWNAKLEKERRIAYASTQNDRSKYDEVLWQQPFHTQITLAASDMGGATSAHDIWADVVTHYSTRNKIVHAKVDEYIQNQEWKLLGTRADEDLLACEGLFDPVNQQKDLAVFRETLIKVRDDWVWLKPNGDGYEPHLVILEAEQAELTNLDELRKVNAARIKDGDETARKVIKALVQLRVDAKRVKDAQKAAKDKAAADATAALEADDGGMSRPVTPLPATPKGPKTPKGDEAAKLTKVIEDMKTQLARQSDKHKDKINELEETIRELREQIVELQEELKQKE